MFCVLYIFKTSFEEDLCIISNANVDKITHLSFFLVSEKVMSFCSCTPMKQ